jgi:ferric-dicitrate binding protein FerR (iron transport regulator)
MTDRPKQNFDENNVPKLIRELPSVEADTDFRERLRSAFTEGRLATEPPREEERPRPAPRSAWWRWLTPVAVAAVLLITVVTFNRAPDLLVLQSTGQGNVRIGGQTIDMNDIDELTACIRAGAEVEAPPGALIDLLAEDVVLIEVTGGTRMSIPRMPGRWFGREVACSLYVGELRVKTGKDFPGSELVVYTPEGVVEVTGTLLSIQRDEGGTCVCVLEGIARVGVDEGDMQAVKPGYRKVMYGDGKTEIIPVKPMHRDGVLNFDKRVGDRIERER